MKVIEVKSVKAKVKRVRKLMESAKNHIMVVHFKTRKDGSKRKMSCRLHVVRPTYTRAPSNKLARRKALDSDHNLMTVFDTNLVNYSKDGKKMTGRGGYRSVNLEGVTRVAVGGEIYKIIS